MDDNRADVGEVDAGWTFDDAKGARWMARSWGGIEFTLIDWKMAGRTSWVNEVGENSLKVILNSDIRLLQSRFCGEVSGGRAIVGRSALVPRGETCVCEGSGPGSFRAAGITIPGVVLAERVVARTSEVELKPRFDYYDPFVLLAAQYLRVLMERTDDLSDMMAEALIQALCLHLHRDDVPAPPVQGRNVMLDPHIARMIKDYVQANLHNRIVLDDLISLAGIRLPEFMTMFRSAFGVTPAQYLIVQRLDRAKQLLINTSLDIGLVAVQTGFSDNSHLTRFFKRAYDMTPSQFRRSYFV